MVPLRWSLSDGPSQMFPLRWSLSDGPSLIPIDMHVRFMSAHVMSLTCIHAVVSVIVEYDFMKLPYTMSPICIHISHTSHTTHHTQHITRTHTSHTHISHGVSVLGGQSQWRCGVPRCTQASLWSCTFGAL